MDKKDVFPRTLSTWIGRKLQEGKAGRAEVNRHLMSVYAWPLQVYFRGSSDRWLGEPEDIVQGFFADRLDREEFLPGWQESGLRLRRWLMNGFCFYLKELHRQRRRARREEHLVEDPESSGESLEDALDHAFAVSVVRQALKETRIVCDRAGLGEHWAVFYRHYYQGEPYKEIVAALGIEAVRASTMARTVAGKFRTVLRGLLARDGALEGEINRELESLLEAVGGGG